MKKYYGTLFAISLLSFTGITQSTTWLTNGNAGLSSTTHFLGTTDNAPIVFKVNNVMSGIIDFTYVNTALGYRSLLYNTSGSTNTATGAYAMMNNTTGYKNTAHGYQALYNGTGSFQNTAMGYQALAGYTGGANNTAVGHQALYAASGFYNTAIGHRALFNNNTGAYNTAVGAGALQNNITGFANVAVGYGAGTTGSFDNTVSINNGGWLNAYHNQAFIGNASTGWIGGWTSWSVYSDARIKTKITEDVKGLDFITRLRPVLYYRSINTAMQLTGNTPTEDYPHKYDVEKIQISGFLAQEVEKAAQESGYNFSGVTKPRSKEELYSLSYEMFVVPLVKGMQEQQALIEKLQERIELLEKKLAITTTTNNTLFNLSPNPAMDHSILSSNANGEIKSLILYNSAGAAVWAQNNVATSNNIKIPLKGFAGGVYLLRIQNNEGWQTVKLVKQ